MEPKQPISPPETPVTLSPEDAALIDALLGTHEPIPSSARSARVQAWLATLNTHPIPQIPSDLAARTLARLGAERMKLPTHTPLEEPTPQRSFALRYLREFAAMAVAASILGIVVTLGVGQARQSGKRVACAANLMSLSTAFASYATVNQDQLPTLAMPMDHNWLDNKPVVTNALAEDHPNSTNMLPLVKASLIRPANLLCAGRNLNHLTPNTDAARGYSYVDMCTLQPPKWNGNHETIVMGDRNPLFDPATTILDPQANSANHAGHGNYLVRADGAVTWETSPNVGPDHDNIWTLGPGPQYAVVYTGTETPSSPRDVFLCP